MEIAVMMSAGGDGAISRRKWKPVNVESYLSISRKFYAQRRPAPPTATEDPLIQTPASPFDSCGLRE